MTEIGYEREVREPVRLASYKTVIRPAIFLGISLLLFLYSDTSLWIAALLLALFYLGVDVFNIDKSDSSYTDLLEEHSSYEPGVLGHYTIDSTESYGLFVSLNGNPVFIDIREDKRVDERRKFARFLSDNADKLEENLTEFVEAHPEFSSRQVVSIGLHAKVLDQGEVFWGPEGYTILRGLEFSLQ